MEQTVKPICDASTPIALFQFSKHKFGLGGTKSEEPLMQFGYSPAGW